MARIGQSNRTNRSRKPNGTNSGRQNGANNQIAQQPPAAPPTVFPEAEFERFLRTYEHSKKQIMDQTKRNMSPALKQYFSANSMAFCHWFCVQKSYGGDPKKEKKMFLELMRDVHASNYTLVPHNEATNHPIEECERCSRVHHVDRQYEDELLQEQDEIMGMNDSFGAIVRS